MTHIVVDRVISQGTAGRDHGFAKTAQVVLNGGLTLHVVEVSPGVYAPRSELGERPQVNLMKPVAVTYTLP